jgi:chorismate-pyruvate lyase
MRERAGYRGGDQPVGRRLRQANRERADERRIVAAVHHHLRPIFTDNRRNCVSDLLERRSQCELFDLDDPDCRG